MNWKLQLWRLYAGLATLAMIAGALKFHLRDAVGYFDVVLTAVELIGLWGFVLNVRILTPLVWKVLFLLAATREFVGTGLVVYLEATSASPAYILGRALAASIVLLVLGGPVLWALFRYGYRCHTLWTPRIRTQPQ